MNLIKGFLCTFDVETLNLSKKQVRTKIKQLKTKKKIVEEFLLHPHSYRADFIIVDLNDIIAWNLAKGRFKCVPNRNCFYMDIKPSYNAYGDADAKAFSINQKWVYKQHGIFVHKIVVEKFFKASFAPQSALFGKSGKRTTGKRFGKCLTIQEFLNKQEE